MPAAAADCDRSAASRCDLDDPALLERQSVAHRRHLDFKKLGNPLNGTFCHRYLRDTSRGNSTIGNDRLPKRTSRIEHDCRLGRSGRLHIERDADGQVWVGGASVTCVDGTVAL